MPRSWAMDVLLVEDDPGDATLTMLALKACTRPRFQVTRVATLAEARRHMDTAGAEVVLLDLSLPDASGAETVQGMRAAAPGVPIVVMTGYDDPDFADRMVSLGAQDYLIKDECDARTLSRAIRYATSRFRAQTEREALVAELRSAVELRNRMFGVLAHDLRNPIGVISGALELLEMRLDGPALAAVSGQLELIRRGCRFTTALIQDVLSLALAEASEVSAAREPVKLDELVAEAVGRARVLAGAKGVEVWAEEPGDEPPTVPGDSIKLAQVLNNLIGNAVKFTPAGGVVRVSCRGEDGGGTLTVADSGQGIAEDMREHLFEPFHRGHEGTAGEPSSGLGLYICSRIVAGHGGAIRVEDAPGGGAQFSVWLPGEGAPAPAPVDREPVFSLD